MCDYLGFSNFLIQLERGEFPGPEKPSFLPIPDCLPQDGTPYTPVLILRKKNHPCSNEQTLLGQWDEMLNRLKIKACNKPGTKIEGHTDHMSDVACLTEQKNKPLWRGKLNLPHQSP